MFLTTFYSIDKSISSARRSDPLLRDTYHWKALRVVLWIIIFSLAAFDVFGGIFLGFRPGPTSHPSAIDFILFTMTFGPIWIPPICGAVILPVAAKRSGDMALHKQLRWFGLSIVFIVGLVFLAPNTGSATSTSYAQQLELLVGLSGAGYSLYRSAKSLVPLNKLPGEARSK